MAIFRALLAKNGLDGLGFGDVALRGGGAVGVDVGDVRRVQSRRTQRHPHAARRPFSSGRGRGDMAGVGGVAVTGHFRVDAGAAGPGVLQFLQHQHSGAIPHDKSVPVPVKGPGGVLGIVVARAHGAHGAKTADAQRQHRRFASPAKIMLASPILIVRQASPRAWVDVAQAEQVARFGPRKFWNMENKPDPMFKISMGIMKGKAGRGLC